MISPTGAFLRSAYVVTHVFLGSKRHLMERVFTDQNEPMYRLAKPLLLRDISRPDFATFIRLQFAATGQQITGDAIDRALEITEDHPHDTQELCYFTWSIARNEGVATTPDIVDRALARVVEAENARYTTLWDQLSAHQRLVLTALVSSGGDGVLSEEYRRHNRLGAASSVQASLRRLVEREFVESSPRGTYQVLDVFLRAWVRRMTSPRSFDPA